MRDNSSLKTRPCKATTPHEGRQNSSLVLFGWKADEDFESGIVKTINYIQKDDFNE